MIETLPPPFFTTPVKIGCGVAVITAIALTILCPPVSLLFFGYTLLPLTTPIIIYQLSLVGTLAVVVSAFGLNHLRLHARFKRFLEQESKPLLTQDVEKNAGHDELTAYKKESAELMRLKEMAFEQEIKKAHLDLKNLEKEFNELKKSMIEFEALKAKNESAKETLALLEKKLDQRELGQSPLHTTYAEPIKMTAPQIDTSKTDLAQLTEEIQVYKKELQEMYQECINYIDIILKKENDEARLENAYKSKEADCIRLTNLLFEANEKINAEPPVREEKIEAPSKASLDLKEAQEEIKNLRDALKHKQTLLEKEREKNQDSFEFFNMQDNLRRAQELNEEYEAENRRKNNRIQQLEARIAELELKAGAEPYKAPLPPLIHHKPPALPLRTPPPTTQAPIVNPPEEVHSSKKRIQLEIHANELNRKDILAKFVRGDEMTEVQITELALDFQDRIARATLKNTLLENPKTAIEKIITEIYGPFKQLNETIFDHPGVIRLIKECYPKLPPNACESIFEYFYPCITFKALKLFMHTYVDQSKINNKDNTLTKCIQKYQTFIKKEEDNEILWRSLTLVFGNTTLNKDSFNQLIEKMYKEKYISKERLLKMGHDIADIRRGYSGKNIEGQLEIARLIARLTTDETE